MSAIIPSTRGGRCGICFEDFDESGPPLTHRGGEGHDGFHETCLKRWCKVNPTCPIDKSRIDCSSILSRIERIRAAFTYDNCLRAGVLLIFGGAVMSLGYGYPKALIAARAYVINHKALHLGVGCMTVGIVMIVAGVVLLAGINITADKEHAD